MGDMTPRADRRWRCTSAMLTASCGLLVPHVVYALVEAVIEFEMWSKWDNLPNRFEIPVPSVDPWVSLVLSWLVPGVITFFLTRWHGILRRPRSAFSNDSEPRHQRHQLHHQGRQGDRIG